MLARLARQFHVDETALRTRLTELRQVSRRPQKTSAAIEHQTKLTPEECELFEILVLQPARATDLFYLSAGVAIIGATGALAAMRMTASRVLLFTGTFAAAAFFLSPSFRGHAVWPTLVVGVLLALT